LNDKPVTVPVRQLVFALDYIEFLDRSWSQIRRSEWGFVQPKPEQNPHGFVAARAIGILRRFNLRWAPPMSQGFFAPQIHEVLRAAVAQGADFQVPIGKLVDDLTDATCMCTTPWPVFDKGEFGDPAAYSYKAALRSFFGAFACGEVHPQDLR